MPDDTTKAKASTADEPQVPASAAKPGAEVPADTTAAVPPAGTASPAPDAEGGSDQLTADEERELGRLLEKRAAAESAGNVVSLKVEEPHESMTFAGVT